MAEFSLPLILRELGGRKRVIILSGSDLPSDQGAFLSLGGRVRGVTHWHPGAAEPTIQIMGPEEGSIEFGGQFHDGLKATVGHALFQQTLIDSVRQAGELVALEYGPIVRTCRWERADFRVLLLSRIDYSIQFEVVSTGRGLIKRVLDGLRRIPGVATALDAVVQVREILDALPPQIGPDRLRQARNEVARAGIALTTAGETLDVLAQGGVIADPGTVKGTQTLLGDARTATAATLTHARLLDWTAVPGERLKALLTAGLSASSVITSTIAMSSEIAKVNAGVSKFAGDATRNVIYLVGAGDTLQRVAQRIYGAASRWPDISKANSLQTQRLVPGQQLIIPNPPALPKVIGP